MASERFKMVFEDYVRMGAENPDPGKSASCRRALDLLNRWFAVDRPTWAPTEVWALLDGMRERGEAR